MKLPRPPAHVEPYVRILGVDGARDFLLTFGGSEVYFPARPGARSQVAARVGPERAAALGEALGHLKARVPTAKPWLAACMIAEGKTIAETVRVLHVTDVTVRRWLASMPGDGGSDDPRTDPRQMRLF
jgi:hypothetical protein